MQSKMADFDTGAATLWTGRNTRVVFDYGHSLHYIKTWRRLQHRKYTLHCTVVKGKSSHGHR